MRLLKISFTLVGLFLVSFSLLLINYTGYAVRSDIELNEIQSEKFQKGIISFTFDDGLMTYYTKVYPSMKARGLNGTIYAMANWTEDGGKFEGREILDFAHLRSMQDDGWEIASHGVKHKKMTPLSDSELEEELYLSKAILEENGLKITSFAFPFGHFDDRTVNVASKYYQTSRPLFLGYNEKDNIDWQRLRSRWVMSSNYNGDVCSWIAYAKEKDYWLILTFHNVEENKSTQWDTSLYDFNEILRCTVEMGVPVKTIREVAAEYQNKGISPSIRLN
ncbi:MAG: polysaccharide deacetylase family protein [Nanoarchaeota archaeon]|nr:polysaccharide deacetylase family protein [Nanoarchaeota archaeon]